MVQLRILSGKMAGDVHLVRRFPFHIGRAAGNELTLEGEGIWEEKKEQEAKKGEQTKQFKDLLEFVSETLKDRVKEVRLSNRLTDSACCLVADEYGINANMERILKAMNQETPESKRVLELNPEHPIMQVLAKQFEQDKGNKRLSDYCELLFDQALLTEGSPIKDPLRFTKLVSELMVEAAKE